MGDINVVNPGSVNVADQSDGEIKIDQAITVSRPSSNSGPTAQGIAFADRMVKKDQAVTSSPSSNAGPTAQGIAFANGMVKKNQAVTVSPSSNAGPITQGGDLAPGRGVAETDPSDVTPAMTAQRSVNGGTSSPVSPNTITTTQNTVVAQPSSVQQFSRTINVNV